MNIKQFTFNPVQENTFIIYNQYHEAIIIDPGFYTQEEEKAFYAFIEQKKLVPKHLFLTHAHFDHILGLYSVVEKTNLIPIMHPLEKQVLNFATSYAKFFEFNLREYEGEIRFIKEGENIVIKDYCFDIIHTPGHSPGSLSLLCKEENIVFSGDVLFEGSIGRTDIPLANKDDLIASVKHKLYALKDTTKVYPGHGNATTIGYEIKNNPFV